MQTRNCLRKPGWKRHGSVLVWTAIFMGAGIGLLALVGDLGYVMLCGVRLQDAADAGALAGAQVVQNDAGLAASQTAAFARANMAAGRSVHLTPNPSNDPGGDIVVGQYNQISRRFLPTLLLPNAVKVTARLTGSSPNGPVQLVFGPALGVQTTTLTRVAIAMIGNRGDANAGIIVLDPHAPSAMSMTGNGAVTEIGGDVQVNSDSSTALSATAYATITANAVDVVGGTYFAGNAHVNGQVNTGGLAMSDPLSDVPAPTKGPDLGKVYLTGKVGGTLNPGYYSGGITLTGQGNLTLNPGIYIVDGAGLNLSGSGTVTANGVMIYVTGTGAVNLSGNGAIHITPPDPTVNNFAGATTYNGISIFQDRASTRPGTIAGSGNLSLDGVIYDPSAQMTLSGNGDTIGSEVIVDTLRLAGYGVIKVNRATGHVPPLPQKVFLVQ